MLHELAAYAAKQGLATQPGFKAKSGKWVVQIEQGHYVGVFERKKEYPMAPDLRQPELVGGGKDSARCHFLIESAKVATGYAPETSQDTAKHATFRSMLRSASVDTPELLACAELLDDPVRMAQLHEEMKEKKVKSSDAVTFLVDEKYLPDLDSWHNWWQGYRASLTSAPGVGTESERMVDFLSGDLSVPALTHGKVGLSHVGGTAFGSALISFDKEAFESFGLSQSQNAAVSEEGVAAYVAALNHLVQKAPRALGGMLILHWYNKTLPFDFDPIYAGFFQQEKEDPNAAADARIKLREILSAVREGGERARLTNYRYHVLALTGSAGRAMVRDWFTGDVGTLVENIQDWFDDLDIVSPSGRRVSSLPKLSALLLRMVDYRPNERINDTFDRINAQLPPVLPPLWRSILTGGPLPDAIAYAALRYAESRYLRAGENDKSEGLDRLAVALVRAWFNRHMDQKEEGIRLTTQLEDESVVDEGQPNPAYHLGRLLAYMDYMQQTALPDVGNRLGKRFYGAAISRPAMVIAPMTNNVEDYLAKIRREKGENVEFAIRKGYTSIVASVARQAPDTLSLKDQAMFMFGFYEQQAEIVRRRIAAAARRKAKNEEAAVAPEDEMYLPAEDDEIDESGDN